MAAPTSRERPADARHRLARPSRALGLLLALGALAWGVLVVGFYYPDVARLVLHPLGAGARSNLEGLGPISLPHRVAGRYVFEDARAVLGVCLLCAGALALGAQLLRLARLSLPRRDERLVSLAVGLGAIGMLVLLLGLARALRPNVLTGLVLVLALNASIWAWRRRAPARPWRTLGRPRLRAASALALLVAAAFVATALVGALGPEIGFDALWYHLALPKLYLHEGRVFSTPFEFVSLYPQGTEMLYAVGLDWGGVRAAKLIDLLFGVLAVLATYRLARRFTSRPFALVAAAAFLTAPTVHWEMTTAYVELPLACFVALAVTELVDWRADGEHRRLWRAAVLLGLALAVKHLALLFLPPLFLVVLLGLARQRRAAGAGLGAALRTGARGAAGFSLAALLVASPWYLRAALVTGDPLFPELFSIVGAPPDWFRQATEQSIEHYTQRFGFGRSPLDLVALPWRLVSSPAAFQGSFGPVFLLLAPFSLLPSSFRRRGLWVVALSAVGFFMLWASPLSSFQARFLVPAAPFFAVLAAAALAALVRWLRASRLPRLGAAAPLCVLLLLVLNLPVFVPWHAAGYVQYTLREVNIAATLDPEAAGRLIAANVHGYGALQYAARRLPASAKILSLLEGGQYYSRQRRLVDYAPLAKPMTWDAPAGRERQAYAALWRAGFRYVVVDEQRMDIGTLAIISPAFRAEYLRLLYRDPEAALYAVRDPGHVVHRLPAGFRETIVARGLEHPTALAFARDGRIFVAEQRGLVLVFHGFGSPPTVFADLRPEVHDFWERGLLGLALDPRFPKAPYVYVFYTFDAPIGGEPPTWGDTCPTPPGAAEDGCVVSGRLSRLTAAGNRSIAERVLVEDWCDQYPSHSVGGLAFGPDGSLYAAAGDGASFSFADYGQKGEPPNPCGDAPAGRGGVERPPLAEGGSLRAQDVRTLSDPTGLDGAVIRIDPATGAGLPSNPLGRSPDANARRIVAYGLRNPYRIAFRPGTAELWIADAGDTRFEEIDVLRRGRSLVNFGWPCYEAREPETKFQTAGLALCDSLYARPGAVTAPFFAYDHGLRLSPTDRCPTASGASVISGLAFGRAGPYPARYRGALYVADYVRGCIWAMLAGRDGVPDPHRIETFESFAAQPVDLEVGPDGNLYYVDYSGGTVRRISFGGG